MNSLKHVAAGRLKSLDILRGLDLFLLVFFQPVFVAFARHWGSNPFFSFMLKQFDHADWVGFRAWDLVMPLFLFMVGVALPFSLSKYYGSTQKGDIYRRVIKRVIILFILGVVVQGNFLSLSPLAIRLYTNTLQAIAVGYLFSSLFIIHLSQKLQIFATAFLLIAYWALLTLFGDFTPEGNFAEVVDKVVLGRFRDGVWYDEYRVWNFSPHYHYTWILTSMVFIVTTMLGVFAGQIMKHGKDRLRNSKYLLIIGLSLLLAGWLLSFQTPIIKKLWTASMTLWSGGWCFLLMALFYYIIDYKGWSIGMNWLNIYGMNSITAYVLGEVVDFRSIANSILYGFEQYVGVYYSALLTFANFLILFFILHLMYKMCVFVKI